MLCYKQTLTLKRRILFEGITFGESFLSLMQFLQVIFLQNKIELKFYNESERSCKQKCPVD